MPHLLWLADVARSTGLPVVEVPGWQHRAARDRAGKPVPMVEPLGGVMLHHTATRASSPGDYPSLTVVRDGRAGLSGPLCHYGLGRSGTVYVVAAGKANHAGVGHVHGISDSRRWVGIEAEHPGGAAPWPPDQLDAYARLAVAVLAHAGLPASRAVGHREFARFADGRLGRKPDPTFDLAAFRADVAARLAGASPARPPAPPAPEPTTEVDVARLPMLRKGATGQPVRNLQGLLIARGRPEVRPDGAFGPVTDQAVRRWQGLAGLDVDGVVGPRTWTALLERP